MRSPSLLPLAALALLASCGGPSPPDAGPDPSDAGSRDAGDPDRCCTIGDLPCAPGYPLGGAAGADGCDDNVSISYDGTWRRAVDEAGCPVWEEHDCCSPSDPENDIYCCGCPPWSPDGGTDGGASDAGPSDAGAPDADVSDAGPGDAGASDAGPTCVTSFRCEAETASYECGVATTDGRRHPDLGAPYCSDVLTREGCTCDVLRCTSPAPMCPGTYRARFRQRLLSGCSGDPGELDGTCDTFWNVAEETDGTLIAERRLLNVHLDFDWAVYEHEVILTAPTVVHLRVEQDAWLEDVSGSGNAGRGELDWAELVP